MRAQVFASVFLLSLLACLPIDALAQERPQTQRVDSARTQAQMQEVEHQREAEEMQQQMRAMMPMLSSMLQNVTQSATAALAEPQTAQNLAKFMRNYFQALTTEGFTREEALRIISSVGFPALPRM